MKKRKGVKGVDRLSELPESLILCILSLLEMRDVVKTSLLSKRWKDLWTTIPSLDFNETGKNLVQTRNFINGVILRWRGTKIFRFKIIFGKTYDASLSDDVDYWVGFATERNVEEIFLKIFFDDKKLDPDLVLLPPQSIYSCWSITELSLLGYSFEVVNVQWDRLKSLKLYGYCNSEELIDQVLCSTPQLEELETCILGRQQKLSIRSSSLRTLIFMTSSKWDAYNSLTFGEESLAICAPSLETLAITGPPYSTCLLSDVSSLSNVTLDFHDICDVRLERTLKQILPAIQHVEELTLSIYCFKMLGVMKDKYSFSNVKTLNCWGAPIEPYDVAGVVEYFPKVEKLFIDAIVESWSSLLATKLSQKHDFGEKWLESEEANNQLKSCLMQLKTIDVSWVSVGSLDPKMLGTCLLCGASFDDYTSRCRCTHCRMLVLICNPCQEINTSYACELCQKDGKPVSSISSVSGEVMEATYDDHSLEIEQALPSPSSSPCKGESSTVTKSIRKLRILCLHGFRQNASCFKGRTASLAKKLKNIAELVFVNAPHELPFIYQAPPADQNYSCEPASEQKCPPLNHCNSKFAWLVDAEYDRKNSTEWKMSRFLSTPCNTSNKQRGSKSLLNI